MASASSLVRRICSLIKKTDFSPWPSGNFSRVERDRLPAVGAALTPSDYLPFWRFDQSARNLDGKSLRLNIFEEVGPVDCSTRWQVKDHMKWILNCPLPEGEILMRYRPTQDIDCR